jgi:hypothetical protein
VFNAYGSHMRRSLPPVCQDAAAAYGAAWFDSY